MAARSLHPAVIFVNPHRGTCANKGNTIQELLVRGSCFITDSRIQTVAASPVHFWPAEVIVIRNNTGVLLGRQLLLEPTLWWDEEKFKRNSRLSDLEHKESKELRKADARLVLCPPTTTSSLSNDSDDCLVACYRREDEIAEFVRKLCDDGQLAEAVDVVGVLVQKKIRITTSLLFSILKACVSQHNLVLCCRVHELVVEAGYESSTFLANNILRMYASHSRLQEVKDVFSKVIKPDAFTWSAVIAAHAKLGEPEQAVELYRRMRRSTVKPAAHVFVAALQACARAANLEAGMQVHADVMESGIQPNLFVCNCLVDMYAKCGMLDKARTIFDSLDTRDVVTWNAMIGGYAQHDRGQEALFLYKQMETGSVVVANHVTFACVLKACSSLGVLQEGKLLHSRICEMGLDSIVMVATCLVDMYAKCGSLDNAQKVFDSFAVRDVVMCNTMVAAYAECGRLDDARRIFDSLVTRDVVTCNTLITGYVKYGRLEDAREMFDSLGFSRDSVTWNAMIAGYTEQGLGQEALALYARMQEVETPADIVTYAYLLKACANDAALQQGKQIHAQITERWLDSDTVIGTCLVDMYAKCGRLEDARRVFDSLHAKDVVTWNAMIHGFGQSHEARKAIECFLEMTKDGVEADATTFTCLLGACSHEGLVREGQQLFSTMVEERGVSPTIEHYTCMVDLLGRAGHLDEAEQILLSHKSDNVGFMSLLNACKVHGDTERGARCFESLVSLDFANAAAYVLIGKLYADAGRWADVERIEQMRKSAGAWKKAAVAGIEVDSHVHTFIVGEERGDISSKARSMSVRLKEEGGHVPRTELVLKQVSELEKEGDLCGHAEKLALAYGLLNTPDGTPLLVTKNLRMCADCHSSTEILSRIEKREIIVRDGHRVHRFMDGSCRCRGRP